MLIATEVAAPFVVPMKLSFMFAIYVGAPFCFYQIWSFVAPGLYKHEKSYVFRLVILSCLLFYSGMLFAFFVICPLALKFFTSCAPMGVVIMTDISNYLDFILNMLFAAGVAFQVPIVTAITIKMKFLSKSQLYQVRPFIIVLAFVLGMFLTPPDVVSQILLAVPIWMLFEAGVLLSR